MYIQRIDGYNHPTINQEILKQHHAFLIDNTTIVTFKQIEPTKAILYQPEYGSEPLYEEFHFYSEHISTIVDEQGQVLKSYPKKEMKKVSIDTLMPSQFMIDENKYQACKTFVSSDKDLMIPVIKDVLSGHYVILDGHTRLKVALDQGVSEAYVFETKANASIFKFVEEARKRKILHVQDMKVVDGDTYQKDWNQWCDAFFNGFAF